MGPSGARQEARKREAQELHAGCGAGLQQGSGVRRLGLVAGERERRAKPGGSQAGRHGTNGAREAERLMRARGLAGARVQA